MINITQLHRVTLRKKASADADWTVLNIEPDDLGQGTQAEINIAPARRSRSSSRGTTETAVPGTFDNFSGTLNIMLDNWAIVGKLIGNWEAATYAGADQNAGQISDAGSNLCGSSEYWDVIISGVCDNGSESEVELTRCQPSVDDNIPIGSDETATLSIALNPIIYNASKHSSDGYPQKSYRIGVENTAQETKLNPTTGEYVATDQDTGE